MNELERDFAWLPLPATAPALAEAATLDDLVRAPPAATSSGGAPGPRVP